MDRDAPHPMETGGNRDSIDTTDPIVCCRSKRFGTDAEHPFQLLSTMPQCSQKRCLVLEQLSFSGPSTRSFGETKSWCFQNLPQTKIHMILIPLNLLKNIYSHLFHSKQMCLNFVSLKIRWTINCEAIRGAQQLSG